jgi:uncharacterized protein YqfA (UPF0365 family)
MGLLMLPAVLAVLASPVWVPALRWMGTARALGVERPFRRTAGMAFRRVRPGDVYGPLERARRAGVQLDADEAEAHLVIGGNLARVVDALVLAAEERVPLHFMQAVALDLSGRDVLEIVRNGTRTPEGGIDWAALLAPPAA